ncbi:MAG TPA: BREX system ATP-binding domain-containing protein [Aggregatilineaceae bacterium]|nr:BREX system ATP-binding domain-containing protein [Aggregatilineaceae bacterium]
MQPQLVEHPQLGTGKLLKTYMGGYEWEVEFDSGRRFRLPAREFEIETVTIWQQSQPPAASPLTQSRPVVLDRDQFRARQTLEALRFGIVPVQDVETLTIGLEAESVSLNRALARSKERGGDVQAVIGDYGFGKSHFIELAARRALRENFIVATASLDLLEVPPGKPLEIYRALTAAMRYPDSHERGLRPLFAKVQENPSAVRQFVGQSPIPDFCPLSIAVSAAADCATQAAYDDLILWISGHIKPTADLKSCIRKPPSLYAVGEVARQYSYLLTGISVLATLFGYSGLAILIDESEHYSLLRARQRGRADAFFQAMICGALGFNNGRIDPNHIPEHARADYPVMFASNPHLFFLFALTESENRMPVDSWLAPTQIVRLDDRFIEKDIRKFFNTLLDYHGLAYGYTFDNGRYSEVLSAMPGLLSRALSQHRINLRELIRTAVTVCDLLYLHDDYLPGVAMQEVAQGLNM